MRIGPAFVAIAAACVFATTSIARADDEAKGEPGRPVDKGTFGIGIVMGEPTGICAKLYLKDDRAIQAAAGGDFAAGGLQIHADYLFHPLILTDRDTYVMPLYIGPGARFVEYNGTPSAEAIGLRAVIGLMFDFKTVPLDAFVEVAAIGEYRFGNEKGLHPALNGGLGIRYYF